MLKRKEQKAKTRRNTKSLRIGHCPCSPDVGDCPRCHVQRTKSSRKTRKH